MAFVMHTVRLVRAAQRAYARKWSFLAAFLIVFFVTLSLLTSFDWIPNPVTVAEAPEAAIKPSTVLTASAVEAIAVKELPQRVEIPSIHVAASVANPTTTDIPTLDAELLSGAVRYPTSAELGVSGNVILFGHSSYLPVVHNQAFKTFDGIQNLKKGDRITVYGTSHAYVYAVDTVTQQKAENAAIPLTVDGSKLTLATCDSFGTKSDRFVVTASLVESYPIAK